MVSLAGLQLYFVIFYIYYYNSTSTLCIFLARLMSRIGKGKCRHFLYKENINVIQRQRDNKRDIVHRSKDYTRFVFLYVSSWEARGKSAKRYFEYNLSSGRTLILLGSSLELNKNKYNFDWLTKDQQKLCKEVHTHTKYWSVVMLKWRRKSKWSTLVYSFWFPTSHPITRILFCIIF